MENKFLKKLQLKPDFMVSVINAPENAAAIFGDMPANVTFSFNYESNANSYLVFAITKAELFEAIKEINPFVTDKTIFWVFYPKTKSILAADLNLMQSWNDISNFGLTPCASVAVNEIWTGIRIKTLASQKKSGIGNAELIKNDYGNYIDVANKIVTLPDDLKAALEKNTNAIDFYETLSYSNKKEYVIWIITARQEKTRLDRIDKMVNKLLSGKKNPSEK